MSGRMSWKLFVTAAVIASGAAIAWTSAYAETNGMAVYQPGDIHIQSSRVFVHVDKTGFGHVHGIEGRIRQGQLRLGATENAGLIVFEMASFVADTDAARQYVGLTGSTDASTQQQVTANMAGQYVLDVRRYPTATFEVQSAQLLPQKSQRGLPLYQCDGKFTLHGVTQPIRVLAEAESKSNWTHLRGQFTIQQTQYGITPFTKAFGAVGVADALKIYGDFWIAEVPMTASRDSAVERH